MENNKSLAEVISSQTSLTKETINDVCDVIMAEFESGKIDQLEFLGKMEFMSQALEKAISKIRQQVVEELEKYGSEAKMGVVKHGITFKLKEAGVKYDYSNSKRWVEKIAALEVIKEETKSLESQLKSLKGKQTIVDEETGECYEDYPPIKSSKTTIEVTIPNK